MGYQALYRVWRPQTFDEMVGQNVIRETLKNAVKTGQISHAYLFTGPRGTGKTSAAKILAKAINCSEQTDGNPCNHCSNCQLISQGQLADIVEIDAASNNGVDEIRDLRENVRYAANEVIYKVYIIDEVHMLTTAAFNALLKTLEEPPQNVVFILATTEPHKIPATILSRTQRFDFQRISNRDIIGRMKEILAYDQIAYDEEALEVIARAAAGGMRDSLSLLDQILAYNPSEVSINSALEVSGSLNQLALVRYLEAIYSQQSELALEILQGQFQAGKQAGRFIEELILFARDILLSHHLNKNQTILKDDEIQSILNTIPADYYYQLIDSLNESQQRLRLTNQADLYLEVATIQLAQGSKKASKVTEMPIEGAQEIDLLQAEIVALKQEISDLRQFIKEQARPLQANLAGADVANSASDFVEAGNEAKQEEVILPRPRPQKQQEAYQLNVANVYHILNQAEREEVEKLKTIWPQVIQGLAPNERGLFTDSEALAAGRDFALVSIITKQYCGVIQQNLTLREEVDRAIQAMSELQIRLIYIAAEDWYNVRQNYIGLRKQAQNQMVEVNSADLTLPAALTSLREDDSDFISQEQEVEPISMDLPVNIEAAAVESEESESPEPTPTPEDTIVQQAYDLFGKENVNVHYE